jgi:hypothetical protein
MAPTGNIPERSLAQAPKTNPKTKKARVAAGLRMVDYWNEAQCLISGGSLPPFAANLVITCLCSQMFMLAESLLSPV